MSDLGHLVWAAALVSVAGIAAFVAVRAVGLMKRRLELREERRKQVEVLSKRFDDVEKMANTVKVEWANAKLVRK